MELAEEYRLSHWVRALLDPRDIIQSPSSARKNIAPPPKFELSSLETPVLDAPVATRRSRRSASPSKALSPTKKIATPRRPRQTKAMKEASAANASAANAALQDALNSAASVADSNSVDGEKDSKSLDDVPEESEQKVKVHVDSTVDVNGDTETTHTNVSVEMPVGLPELPLPEDTEAMIAKAKEMVAEANKLQAEQAEPSSAKSKAAAKKRKVEQLVEDDSEDIDAELPAQPAKKARVLESQLKREKVRNRAMVGITATLAIA